MKRNIFIPILILAALTACTPSTNENVPQNNYQTEVLNSDSGESVPDRTTEAIEENFDNLPIEMEETTEESTVSDEIPYNIYEQGDSVPQTPTKKLTLDEAREIALQRAGLSIDEVTVKEAEYELDDGVPEYQFEFLKDGIEYSVDIHAETGEILEYETEVDD